MIKIKDILYKALTETKKLKGLVIQSLEDFLKEEGVEITEAKLGDDIPMQVFGDDALQGALGRAQDKAKKKSDKYNVPMFHASTSKGIEIKDENGRSYDLDKLKKMITEIPQKILKKNEKMKNSIGADTQFYNIGLPAIKGLIYDEQDNQFKIVSTCPKAGACQRFCYAHKGGYIQYPASSQSTTRLLNLLVNKPEVFESIISKELASAVKYNEKSGTKVALRWHDTGDFFSESYVELAFKIAKKFPEVEFYAYTKNASLMGKSPDNFIFNFSAGAKPSETKKVDFSKTKNSRVIAKDVFWDLIQTKGNKMIKDSKKRMQYISPDSLVELKNRVAKLYGLNVKDIMTYDEIMKKPVGSKMKWSVIVASGDGDDAANRKDVRDTLLLIH